MSGTVVTRFAPSPTGFLHVGGARAAIFNYLYARQNGGIFRLRIEDTDRERSSTEMIQKICDGLQWLGIQWDDEIVFQGANVIQHRQMAQLLIEKEWAYPCFCTVEDLKVNRQNYKYNRHCSQLSEKEISKNLAEKRSFSVRLKIPEGKTDWYDAIHGQILVENNEIEDFVILRSNQTPTYQLAAVVDDHEMGVNSIIRGDDHISNTSKQILLHKAFDWKIPNYAHVPLILGKDRTPLSKRHGTTSIEEYQKKGVLPEAMFNYLTLLGWSPDDNSEIIDRHELLNRFSLDGVSKKSAIFDEKKLAWMNQQYILRKECSDIYDEVCNRWRQAGFLKKEEKEQNREWLLKIINLCKPRSIYLDDFIELARYYFKDPIEFDLKGLRKYLKVEQDWVLIEGSKKIIQKIELFLKESIEEAIRPFAADNEVPAARIIHPLRLAITGRTASPSLFEVMELIGKKRVLRRLTYFLEQKDRLKHLMKSGEV